MTDLARLVVRLEAENSKYVSALDAANKKLSKFSSDHESAFEKIGKSFTEVGLAAAVGIGLLVTKQLEAAESIANLALKMGIGTESLQELQFAFKASGVDGEQFDGLIRKLNVSISDAAGNAKSNAAIAFRLLGVSVRDANGNIRATDDVLKAIADSFTTFGDGANKNALAVQLLGRAGGDAIPALDGGSAALATLAEQAHAAGAVMSDETVQSAKELHEEAERLTTALTTGLANRILGQTIPGFKAMAESMLDVTGRSDQLEAAAGVLSLTLKGLVTAGIIVTSVFQQVGRILYGIGAALVSVAKGDFHIAAEEIAQAFVESSDNISHDLDKIHALFTGKGEQVANDSIALGKKIAGAGGGGGQGPNLQAAIQAQAAADAAIKRLEEFNGKVTEQVAKFSLGEAAAVKYDLTLGNLSKSVKDAGAQGQVLANSILREADALERLKNVDALTRIDADIQNITGHTAQASAELFDLQNKLLKSELTSEGDTAGLKRLDTQRQLIVAQAQFNELQEAAVRIEDAASIKEQSINDAVLNGKLTEIDADKQLQALRQQEGVDLDAIYQKEKAIADVTDDPAIVANFKKFGAQIDSVKSSVDVLGQKAKQALEDDLSTPLSKVLQGTESAKQGLEDFFRSIAANLADLASKNIAQTLFGGLNISTGSGGGGFLGSLASLFGGGRAAGGAVVPGKFYRVNERTPESEWFVPQTAGSIVPAEKVGGTNHYQVSVAVQAPQGTVSRQTLLQTGAATARGISLAHRRNN